MSRSCLACPADEASSSSALLTSRTFASCSSVCRDRFVLQALELLPHELDRFDDSLRRRVELDAEIAAVGVGVERAADAVDEAAFLAQLLPQARFEGAAAAENLVEHAGTCRNPGSSARARAVRGECRLDWRRCRCNRGRSAPAASPSGAGRVSDRSRLPRAEGSIRARVRTRCGEKVADDGDRREIGAPVALRYRRAGRRA